MSKFIEMLENTRDTAPSPLGFGAASRQTGANPQIVLVGQATVDELKKSSKLLESQVDAVLLTLNPSDNKALDSVSDSLKERVWGVRVGAINEEQAARLKEKGCDFVVFDPENTAAALLNDEDLGRVIAVGQDLEEDTGQAIHGLPIDCALFSPAESLAPLTVQKLIDIEAVRGLVGKHFVITAPPDLGQSELESLRNAGIGGLVVNLSATEDISKAKEAISNLPRRRPERSRRRLMAQAPVAGFASFGRGGEQEEDDDDDDDDS